jgi:hypothetical protein
MTDLRQQFLRSLAADGVKPRLVTSADLGDGPHRPFGSALIGGDGGHASPLPRIGRTIKPKAAGPCKVCGERKYFCGCESAA